MTKKATITKAAAAGSPQSSRRRAIKRQAEVRPSNDDIASANGLSAEPAGSEEEVLSSLLSSITDNLGDQGVEKAQLHEFLNLILDTDPALKEEILRGIRLTK